MKTSPSFLPRLKREEGFSATAYWDDAPGGGPGHWSWGYGSQAPGPGATISEQQAEDELLTKVSMAEGDYRVIFQQDPPGLTQARYDSIIDMLYNLGIIRFGGFSYTIAAIREGNWGRAAAHAQQSLWYRQVGQRAKQIVEEFRTGVGECDRFTPEVQKDGEGKAEEKASAWEKVLELLGRFMRLVRCGDKKNLSGGGLT